MPKHPIGMENPHSTPSFYKCLALNLAEYQAALKRNRIPCLVIHDKNDPIVPFKHAELLATKTSSPTFLLHDYGLVFGITEDLR